MSDKAIRRKVRRVLMRALKARWRRCYWSWPLGHDWPRPCWASNTPSRVSHCRACGKPAETTSIPSIKYFNEADLLDLADEWLADGEVERVGNALAKIPNATSVL